MRIKKKGYIPLLILSIIFTLAALTTLIPQPSASRACYLGYKAHCSFTPWGTLICLALAGIICIIRKRYFTEIRRKKQK